MAIVFQKPKSIADIPMHYCPGCTHGIVHRLVAEAMDDLNIEGKTVGVAPVGCAVMNYDYFIKFLCRDFENNNKYIKVFIKKIKNL